MATIFDYVTSPNITAYWEEKVQGLPPFLGETLFPANKKLGLSLDWIKGAKGLPVVLKASAFDVGVVPRPRIGFEKLSTQMPFFKESKYVDEEMRQQLNMVLESGNQAYIDSIVNRIFDDEMDLLEGARARREMLRMMALTTGTISVTSNGQVYTYDYGVPNDHKATVSASWSNPTTDIMADIAAWQDKIEEDTGVRPTRAICDRKTWGYIQKNQLIAKKIYVMSDGSVRPSDNQIKTLIGEELDGLQIQVYSKLYTGDTGASMPYVPADTFVLFPEGQLGNTWFGTTPEESDLLSSRVANVSITDTGVAVTTMEKADPVNVETKVSMITLPSFEAANQVFIADVTT